MATLVVMFQSLYTLSSILVLVAAEAFAPSRLPVAVARLPISHTRHISCSKHHHSTTLRGGAIMKSTKDNDASKEDETRDESTLLQEDLKSMQFCYRAALFSVATTLYTQQGSSLRTMLSNWNSLLDVVSHVNILGFAIGVWNIRQALLKEVGDTTPQDLCNLANTMRIVWFFAWSILTLSTIALSTSLNGILGNTSPFAAPITVGAIAITSALIIAKSTTTPPAVANDSTLNQARTFGFLAARNMEFCMAGFVLDAVVTFLATLASSEPLLNKCLGMLDVLQPAAIFVLVQQLVKVFRPAVLRATDPKTFNSQTGYSSLYQAETGFYTKIGNVFMFPAFAKLATPYLVSLYELVKSKYIG